MYEDISREFPRCSGAGYPTLEINYLRMKREFAFMFIFILFLSGCEKDDALQSHPDQLVLFQVEYVNYAWGYSHSGIVIDSAGNVGYFRLPESWHTPDSLGYISESDMNDNFRPLKDVPVTVEKEALIKYYAMLPEASQGELSKTVNRMADDGATVYSGFLYLPSIKKYKQVLIRQWGDWEIENYSPDAEEIFKWLKVIYTATLESMRN
jgi:hypothetical protein